MVLETDRRQGKETGHHLVIERAGSEQGDETKEAAEEVWRRARRNTRYS